MSEAGLERQTCPECRGGTEEDSWYWYGTCENVPCIRRMRRFEEARGWPKPTGQAQYAQGELFSQTLDIPGTGRYTVESEEETP